MEFFNLLLFLFIYIPLNIGFMMLAILLLNVSNKIFNLYFPAWIVGFAAGILVFVMLVSFVETSSMNSSDTDLYYATTAAINLFFILLALGVSRIGRIVFRKEEQREFIFGRQQKIAALVYLVAVGSLASIPALTV